MKTLFSLVAALVIIGASAGHAAFDVVNYHNIHIWTTDPDAAVEWYVEYLGAVEGGTGSPAVRFGEALVVFRKTDTATTSVGSVIDHYGISVPDIEATMKGLEGSGAKILEPVREAPGLFKLAFIEDPFGAKVELVQDAEWPDFHHVHLRVPDPTATLAWYEDAIGGTRDKLKGKIEGLRYGGVWLVAQDSGGEKMAPSDDRAIQNVAWVVTSMNEAVASLKAAGAKTLIEPFAATDTVNVAFFEDPDGVTVEVIERTR
jgi:catechol 2,3-dioxygenase-like lactoylglutathione lyase family enzyme